MNLRSFVWLAVGPTILTVLFAMYPRPARGQSGNDWRQLQRDPGRTGYCPQAVRAPFRARWVWFGSDWVLRSKDSGASEPKWKDDLRSREDHSYRMPASVPFSFASSMQPIVAAGRVFVADVQGRVYAIDADDGTTIWTADNPGGSLWSGTADEKIVVFASVLGCVTAFSASTGQPLWQVDTRKAITSAPCSVGEVMYVASQSGHVYAVRASDGEVLWKSSYLGAGIQGGLCWHKGRIYTGTEAMEAVAIDAGTGKVVTKRKLMGQSFRFVWPVAVKDRVIFTTVPIICVGSEYVNDPVLAGRPGQAVGWDPKLKPGYANVSEEQQALRRWLAGRGKYWQTCFALRAETLERDYIVATGATEGCGTPPEPPVVDDQGRPLLWWATAHPMLTNPDAFGTNFSVDISAIDLATGERAVIDNGRLAGQTTETDNLYGMTVGSDMLYLRQNFRGTYCINLKNSEGHRISAVYRYRDQGGWPAAINYAQGQIKGSWGPKVVRVPDTPPAPSSGRVGPSIACGRLFFTENFCLTCVETGE